ncbi:MAG: S9 family peptidase [Acidobacteria bacterium]|nr:S9 family peptidase [Acidobacteriota bacterium]
MLFAWLFCLIPTGDPQWNLDQIMQDPIWLGALPQSLHESPLGLVLEVSSEVGQPNHQLLWDGSTFKPIPLEKERFASATSVKLSATSRVWLCEEELWVQDQKGFRALFRSTEDKFLIRSIDANRFVFLMQDQLFSCDVRTGLVTQLTNVKMADEPAEPEGWASHEEAQLIQYVDQQLKNKEQRKSRQDELREKDPLTLPKTVYLGKGNRFSDDGFLEEQKFFFYPDANLKYAVLVLAPEKDGDPTQYAQLINEEAQVKAREARPKVGSSGKSQKCGVLDMQKGVWTEIDFKDLPGLNDDPLADIKNSFSEADQKRLTPFKGPRALSFYPSGFEGDSLLITVIANDYKDRWICLYQVKDQKLEVLHHHTDKAWLQMYLRQMGENPAVSARAFWLNPKTIGFLSDEQGYQNLFQLDLTSRKAVNLTSGPFEVFSPFLSEDGKFWYFHSNRIHPGEFHFYRMPASGGNWEPLTEGEGAHSVLVRENANQLFDIFSTATEPPVVRFKAGKTWKTVYTATSPAFAQLKKVQPQFVTYSNQDGLSVHARLYQPEKPNGAGVVFVHGAGYLQNADKGWSGYFREFMFHQLLVQEGFTVLDPDFRASAGYGRDWRTAIYRHMGDKDLMDVVDGATYLTTQGVDQKRIGVYGGSYGGFITLMAMFTAPDVFQSGAALRPVTDWAYYNHWYTSRILNTPQNDPVAYRQSSPIYFAEGLKGHLLICHGMVDDNVHFQDSVRLAQRLIELKKANWSLAPYPVEPHGFRMPTSWYDEYRRIHELFLDTLIP